MPKIQHIAITCEDNVAVAEFYKQVFGMVEIERRADKVHPGVVHIGLSDGNINLALVPKESGFPQGLDHIGFEVEDVAAITDAAVAEGAKNDNDRHRDGRGTVIDPAGCQIQLTEHGKWWTAPQPSDVSN